MKSRIPTARLTQLRSIPLFAACNDAALGAIDGLVDDHEVTQGTTLTREGGSGRESFIIVTGAAEVTVRGERIVELGPGAVFGEMAVLQCEPRSATVTALTPMHLLVVSPRNLSQLLTLEGVARKVLIALSERLQAANDRVPPRGAARRSPGRQPASEVAR